MYNGKYAIKRQHTCYPIKPLKKIIGILSSFIKSVNGRLYRFSLCL